jgi:hypothetical protein
MLYPYLTLADKPCITLAGTIPPTSAIELKGGIVSNKKHRPVLLLFLCPLFFFPKEKPGSNPGFS